MREYVSLARASISLALYVLYDAPDAICTLNYTQILYIYGSEWIYFAFERHKAGRAHFILSLFCRLLRITQKILNMKTATNTRQRQ